MNADTCFDRLTRAAAEPPPDRHAWLAKLQTGAFNHSQAEKHASWSWERMRAAALDAATLHTLFTTPALLHANRLEGTRLHRKRLPNGAVIPKIARGWALWITCLEQAGVEHAPNLGMPH